MRARSPRLLSSLLGILVLVVVPAQARDPHRLASWTPARTPVIESAVSAASTWAYTYGGAGDEDAWIVRQNADGTFILGGTTGSVGGGDVWLAKLDASGTILWQKTYGTPGLESGDAMSTTDGGIMLTGSTDAGGGVNTTWMCKLNAEGVIQWQKQYDGEDSNYTTLYSLSDGTFIATGTEMSFLPLQFSFLLARVDSAGNTMWAKKLSSTQNRYGTVIEQPDGTIMVAGTRMDMASGSTDMWLLKVNTGTGTVVWEKTYGTAGNETGASVARQSDGGFLFLGAAVTPSGSENLTDILVVRLDATGSIVWQKKYGGPQNDLGFLAAGVDGGWILTGETESFGAGGGDIWLVKLESNGNIQWQKTYGGPQRDAGAVFPDGTGGYFLVADTESFGSGQDDLWILRLDGQGNITWQRTYGGANEEAGAPWRLADGGILVSGITGSYGGGKDDSFVMRLDSNGTLPGSCPFIKTTSISPQTSSAVPVTTSLVASAGTSTLSDDTVPVTTASLTTGTASLGRQGLCGAAPVLSGTASANPTSGVAPLAVSFTGSATNGTPPYTWDWSFGDGSAHATQQSPSHTFLNPGTYPVTLTVRDATGATATDSHLSVTVSGGGGCVVTCTTTVPATGTVGSPVSFQATVTATGCTLAPTAMWSFGDGTTSTQLNATHTYSAADTFNWTFIASSPSGGTPCLGSGEISIRSGGQQHLYMIPSVAHSLGGEGTQWRTNFAAVNRSGSVAHLTLSFYPYAEGSAPIVRTHDLANGATFEWQDAVVNLFGLPADANNKGTVHIASDVPIFATSRTFNQIPAGTFGQYYPALTVGHALPAGQTGVIPQLKKNTAFRTNLGILNLGTAPCTVAVKLRGSTGTQLGSTRTQVVSAGRYWQQDKIFDNVGAGTCDTAFATVEVQTTGGKVWAYGSVVDNPTGDPTTIPMLSSLTAGSSFVAAAAHLIGSGGANWRTNLAVVNRGTASTTMALTFLPYAAGTSPVIKSFPLAAGATWEWQDVLVSLFQQTATSIKGSLQITSLQPLAITSRTYNQTAGGTYGQYYQAVQTTQALTSGQVGVIPQLKKNTAFRAHLGVMNVGTASVTVAIRLWSPTGSQIGTTKTQTVAVGRYWQQDNIFDNVGAGNRDIAYATVEVQTSGGRIWAYGSVVDNVTNDPTTFPVLVQQ
ncbi:MAG: PKD domain-containing protein [Thermoanaerobaculaceae bacterium]|jgi:PKD repeat protein|nr:PKD domain-containing protein [Thermoanaerobaculaceae bacterium]